MPDIPEDLTTEEQLRRCRELLAANLCAQGVRAMPDESLPQLIAKVSKIDRQQRHIDALQNYATSLKNFATSNACDYALYAVASNYQANTSMSTAAAANLTYAYAYFAVPTTFSIGGVNTTVSAANVVLVGCSYITVPWGTSSAGYNHYYSFFMGGVPNFSDCRTFSVLKARNLSSAWSIGQWGTTMSTAYGNQSTNRMTRVSDSYYSFYTTPYSTSYDYWHNNCYLYYPIWAVKLPTLGTAPNNLFPATPVIPKQEFYY